MKIYSDMEDLTDPLADRIQAMIDGITPDHPFLSMIPLLKEFVKSQQEAYAQRVENAKLRLKWAVRGLEKEIEEEGGMLIIDKGGKLETRGFSNGLSERIVQEVKDRLNSD